MKELFQKLSYEYRKSSILNKIIYLNIGIFLFISIFESFAFITQTNIQYYLEKFYLPADTNKIIARPWTFLTYMFLHNNILHLLFNMIWLHFGSKLFLQYFNGKQLLSVYILGGISGGLFYMFCFNILPAFTNITNNSVLLGASSSVIAIFIAISSYKPNYKVLLPLIGNIQLKYIALSLIILDLVNIEVSNAGGHISHLGGAIFGFLYVSLLKKGIDISVNFYKFIGYFTFSKKNKEKKTYKRKQKFNDDFFLSKKAEKQKKINIILEKISKSGYESLSKVEKEILFKESKK